MSDFCINKSGTNVPIYNTWGVSNPIQIGTLYNREAYGLVGSSEGSDHCIQFLSSSGGIATGFLLSPPSNTVVGCASYPYGYHTIGSTTYITFIFRQKSTVYTASGKSVWGSVAAGRRVACLTSMSGDNKAYWKGINYVESSSGSWVAVTGDDKNYGFVDTGLANGSSASTIRMYGSW